MVLGVWFQLFVRLRVSGTNAGRDWGAYDVLRVEGYYTLRPQTPKHNRLRPKKQTTGWLNCQRPRFQKGSPKDENTNVLFFEVLWRKQKKLHPYPSEAHTYRILEAHFQHRPSQSEDCTTSDIRTPRPYLSARGT